MCVPIKLNFLLCERKPLFDALCTEQTFGLSDVFVVTVLLRLTGEVAKALCSTSFITMLAKTVERAVPKIC